jgi:hypothetical protein
VGDRGLSLVSVMAKSNQYFSQLSAFPRSSKNADTVLSSYSDLWSSWEKDKIEFWGVKVHTVIPGKFKLYSPMIRIDP